MFLSLRSKPLKRIAFAIILLALVAGRLGANAGLAAWTSCFSPQTAGENRTRHHPSALVAAARRASRSRRRDQGFSLQTAEANRLRYHPSALVAGRLGANAGLAAWTSCFSLQTAEENRARHHPSALVAERLGANARLAFQCVALCNLKRAQ